MACLLGPQATRPGTEDPASADNARLLEQELQQKTATNCWLETEVQNLRQEIAHLKGEARGGHYAEPSCTGQLDLIVQSTMTPRKNGMTAPAPPRLMRASVASPPPPPL